MRADPKRADAPASLGLREWEGLACVTEAAIAWRSGDRVAARELAERGRAVWARLGENAGARLLSSALLVAASDPGAFSAEAIESLARESRSCPTPGVGIQALALLASRRQAPESAAEIERLAKEVPRASWTARIDVMSVTEAPSFLERGSAS